MQKAVTDVIDMFISEDMEIRYLLYSNTTLASI